MLPEGNFVDVLFRPYPSYDYRINEDRIAGYVQEIAAIQQAVLLILSTERYAYQIYGQNFGVEFEKYIGKDIDYVRTNILGDIKDALMQDDRILDVELISITQPKRESVLVQFTVYATLGAFDMDRQVDIVG